MSRGDGSSEALGRLYMAGIVSVILLTLVGVGYWLHARKEASEIAACEARNGIRVVGRHAAYCIRSDALVAPQPNEEKV